MMLHFKIVTIMTSAVRVLHVLLGTVHLMYCMCYRIALLVVKEGMHHWVGLTECNLRCTLLTTT